MVPLSFVWRARVGVGCGFAEEKAIPRASHSKFGVRHFGAAFFCLGGGVGVGCGFAEEKAIPRASHSKFGVRHFGAAFFCLESGGGVGCGVAEEKAIPRASHSKFGVRHFGAAFFCLGGGVGVGCGFAEEKAIPRASHSKFGVRHFGAAFVSVWPAFVKTRLRCRGRESDTMGHRTPNLECGILVPLSFVFGVLRCGRESAGIALQIWRAASFRLGSAAVSRKRKRYHGHRTPNLECGISVPLSFVWEAGFRSRLRVRARESDAEDIALQIWSAAFRCRFRFCLAGVRQDSARGVAQEKAIPRASHSKFGVRHFGAAFILFWLASVKIRLRFPARESDAAGIALQIWSAAFWCRFPFFCRAGVKGRLAVSRKRKRYHGHRTPNLECGILGGGVPLSF